MGIVFFPFIFDRLIQDSLIILNKVFPPITKHLIFLNLN